ncbi:hypothetical protein CBD41_02330 [bacterium TMED181]|nr:hypothetical protein [Planctomycetota bacterium]OUW46601.1 MAG: hypothetical protein CBD41_02330 [bacterium TMED181]
MSNTAENPGRLKTFWLPVLLGISVGANLMLLVGSESAPKVAHGETGTASNGFVMTSFVMQGKGAAEGLAIFDTNTKKLWTGFESGNGFNVHSVRDLNYDFVPQEYSQKGKQKPSVKAMKDAGRK